MSNEQQLIADYLAKGGKVTTVADLSKASNNNPAIQLLATASNLDKFNCVTHYKTNSGKVTSQNRDQHNSDPMSAILQHRDYVFRANGRHIALWGDTVVTNLETGDTLSLAYYQIWEAFLSGEAQA
jgi:hypothetical protein